MDNIKQWYTVAETAAALNRHYQTVWRMIQSGDIKTRRLTSRGNYRIPASEIQRLNNTVEPQPKPAVTETTLRELARA